MTYPKKTVILTTPVIGDPPAAGHVLLTNNDLMDDSASPSFWYGAHGGVSKLPLLSAAQHAAGRLQQKLFLLDLTLHIEQDPDEKFEQGQRMATKLHLLSAKSMRTNLNAEIAAIWFDLAAPFSKRALKREGQGVDWTDPRSYMLAYPQVAPLMFDALPGLRLLILPMKTRLMKDETWIGMFPKHRAFDLVTYGAIRMRSLLVGVPVVKKGSDIAHGYKTLPEPPH